MGESFSDFYILVKTFAEYVDIRKVPDTQCEEKQLKQVLLMGVRDQESVKELIRTTAIHTLDKKVRQCYTFEATRRTTSALVSPAKSICTTSRYQTEKKMMHRLPRSPTPNCEKCDSSTRSHTKAQCPAKNTTCCNCGNKEHLSKTLAAQP